MSVGLRDALWLCGGVARGAWDEPLGVEDDPLGDDDEDPLGMLEPPCFPPIIAMTAAAAAEVSGVPSGPQRTPLMSWTRSEARARRCRRRRARRRASRAR